MRRLTVQFVTRTGYFKLKGIVLCIHYASFTWNIMNGMRLQTLLISPLTVVILTASPNPVLKPRFVTFVYSFCGQLFIYFFCIEFNIKIEGKTIIKSSVCTSFANNITVFLPFHSTLSACTNLLHQPINAPPYRIKSACVLLISSDLQSFQLFY